MEQHNKAFKSMGYAPPLFFKIKVIVCMLLDKVFRHLVIHAIQHNKHCFFQSILRHTEDII